MPIIIRRIANIYLNTTLVYGFTRAVTYDYESEKHYYNKQTGVYEEKEMLIFDKIGRISFKTFAATVAWPVMMGDDLTRLECAVRGKNPSEYQ